MEIALLNKLQLVDIRRFLFNMIRLVFYQLSIRDLEVVSLFGSIQVLGNLLLEQIPFLELGAVVLVAVDDMLILVKLIQG